MLVSSMHGAYRRDDVVLRHALDQIADRSRTQRSLNLAVAFRHAEHDDAGFRKLSADRDERVRSVGARQTQIHQSDVGTMTSEFLDGLLGGARLRDHAHVRLRTDHPRQTLTDDGMVLDAEDPNDGAGLSHRYFHSCDSWSSSELAQPFRGCSNESPDESITLSRPLDGSKSAQIAGRSTPSL